MPELRILFVEDNAHDAELALYAIKRAGIPCTSKRVDTEPEFVQALKSYAPDVILCDFSMPQFNGLAALRVLRHHKLDIPFIFVSGTIREEDAVRSLTEGATDYVLKGNYARLPSTVQRAVRETSERVARRALEDKLQESLDKLHQVSHFDAVTSLPTRSRFCEQLDARLGWDGVRSATVVVVFDIERFHLINDSLGWDAGDRLLDMLARRLSDELGARDALCRIGSDVFAFYSSAANTTIAADDACRHVANIMQHPFEIDGQELRLSIKHGIAAHPEHGSDAEMLLRNAELALKKAKSGADRYLFYSPIMQAHADELLHLENRLRIAIADEQFALLYQPKYAMDGMTLVGMEALLRWDSPDLGRVAPGEFIGVLEETGLMTEVGNWVLQQAVKDCQAWRAQGHTVPRIAINISPRQLEQKDFLARVASTAYECLDLEITESALMSNIAEHAAQLKVVREAGIGVEIDDFGTGYSSLSYIANLPVSGIKIDRSFISGISAEGDALKIVSAIITLARSLGLKVTAEGVETEDQWTLLRGLKCDVMQGYLFAKPLSAQAVAPLLTPRVSPEDDLISLTFVRR